jgi:hypothetical protein
MKVDAMQLATAKPFQGAYVILEKSKREEYHSK